MSQIWEKQIQEWYEQSSTANLSYLDLATTVKPSHKQLAHNLSVIYDRVSLKSRIDIKNFKEIKEILASQESRISGLEKGLRSLSQVFLENRPLTATEVRRLVAEIAAQPKLVEEQALKITQNLEHQIREVEKLLIHIKESLLG